MKYIICYDIGTSGIKCGLFDSDLNCRIITRCNYEVRMSADKTAEADPKAYVEGIAQCTREAVEKSGVPKKDVVSICSTTQGETLIPVDSKGEPLHRAIVWLDGRAEEEAAELREIFPDALFKEKTGLPGIDGYTPLAKLLYIKRKMPDVYEKTDKFMLLEDYVTFRLTGRAVSEKSLLSSTGYFDLTCDDLWEEALETIGVGRQMIPEVTEPGDRVGRLTKEAADMLGFTTETVLYAGAMDQLAGTVGCGNHEIGNVHETTGTAMIVATTMSLKDCMARDHALTVYRHVEKDKYLLLSISRTATTVLKWFAEQFCDGRNRADIYEYLSSIAAEGKPGANGLIMLPYFEGMIGGENAEDIKGVFWNIGLHNTKDDFVRAIFEGIAYMLEDNIRQLFGDGRQRGELISIGGASRSEIWCRIKADVTGKEIVTMPEMEAALFGSACIAAVGGGMYASLGEAVSRRGACTRYTPDGVNEGIYEKEYLKYLKMKESLEKLYRNR